MLNYFNGYIIIYKYFVEKFGRYCLNSEPKGKVRQTLRQKDHIRTILWKGSRSRLAAVSAEPKRGNLSGKRTEHND